MKGCPSFLEKCSIRSSLRNFLHLHDTQQSLWASPLCSSPRLFQGIILPSQFGEAWSFASWWVIHALTRYDVQVYCGRIPSSQKSLDDVKKKKSKESFFFYNDIWWQSLFEKVDIRPGRMNQGDSIGFLLASSVIQRRSSYSTEGRCCASLCKGSQQLDVWWRVEVGSLDFLFVCWLVDWLVGFKLLHQHLPKTTGTCRKWSLCGMRCRKCPLLGLYPVFPSHDDRQPTGMYLSSFGTPWLAPRDLIYST